MKRIIIDISDDGELRLETSGFSGKACIEETEFLKKVLGTETHRNLTPAFYEQKQHVKKYLNLCG